MRLGIVVAGGTPPETVPRLAALSEEAGLDQVWVAEDGFAIGVVATAALALARTSRVQVGFGIVAVVPRHPAVLAMEIASIGRSYPHRFVAGLGLGVTSWLDKMGLHTASQLTAVRDGVGVLRRLLAGETVSHVGEQFRLSRVALDYPPGVPVPLHIGAVGPRMLQLSGEIADGTILSVGASTLYATWARQQIDLGCQRAGRSIDTHELTVFALYAVHHDRDRARGMARAWLARHLYHVGSSSITAAEGIDAEISDLRSLGSAGFEREMPDRWVDEMTICGEPLECADKIKKFADAGVSSLGLLMPSSAQVEPMLRLTNSEVRHRV